MEIGPVLKFYMAHNVWKMHLVAEQILQQTCIGSKIKAVSADSSLFGSMQNRSSNYSRSVT